MQTCCFGFEQHRGSWAVFGNFSPRGARSKGGQQPDGRVAHNQKLYTSLVSIEGFSPPVSCAQGRLVNEMHVYEIHAHEMHACEIHAYRCRLLRKQKVDNL